MKIIIALLVATALFLLLKVFRLGIKRLRNLYSGLKFMDNLTVATEFFFWLVYSFWAVYFLFRGKFYYQYLMYALILIILVFVSWFLIRDIFAGIIFRIKHNLRNGSFIKAGEFSGQIKTQQVTCLKIITDDNRLLRVPYSRLVNAVISEASGRGTVEEHLIHVKIDASIGKTNAETFIRNALLSNPWNNLKEEPAVRYQKENENGYFYDITLLSKNLKHIKNIEMALEEIPSIHII